MADGALLALTVTLAVPFGCCTAAVVPGDADDCDNGRAAAGTAVAIVTPDEEDAGAAAAAAAKRVATLMLLPPEGAPLDFAVVEFGNVIAGDGLPAADDVAVVVLPAVAPLLAPEKTERVPPPPPPPATVAVEDDEMFPFSNC